LTPAPNSSGWNNTPVTVSFPATDSLSGVATVTPPVTVTTEGAQQDVSGTATDRAGNSSTVHATVNLDTTPPRVGITFYVAAVVKPLFPFFSFPLGHIVLISLHTCLLVLR